MDSSIVPKTVGPTTRSKRAIATLETDATQKLPVSRLNMEEPPEPAVKTEAGSSSCVKAEPQQLKKVKKETATTSRVQEPQPQPRRAVKAEPQPSTAMHTYDEAPSPTGYSLDDEVESDNEDCCIM